MCLIYMCSMLCDTSTWLLLKRMACGIYGTAPDTDRHTDDLSQLDGLNLKVDSVSILSETIDHASSAFE